jgi:ribosome maturation factor RimP
MAVSQKVQKLTDMLAPAVAACGFELWGIEFFPQGKRSCLRIYIDGPEGVTVDGCAMVSHQVERHSGCRRSRGRRIYAGGVFSGLGSSLVFLVAIRARFVGGEVLLRLLAPLNGRRRYKGVLQQVQGETLELLSEGQVVLVPFAQVDKGNVVPNV